MTNEYFADEWLSAVREIKDTLRGVYGDNFYDAILFLTEQQCNFDRISLRFNRCLSAADQQKGVEIAANILRNRRLHIIVTLDHGEYI